MRYFPGLVVLGAVAVIVLGRGESITLIADEDLPTYTVHDDQIEKTNTVIRKGEVHRVTGCTDLKDYFGTDVSIAGKSLMVIGARSSLDGRPFLYAWRWPIVWSCP